MTRTVDWAESALSDLLDQITFIAADDPNAADRVAQAIRATGAALGDFATGHPGRVSGTYEKSLRGLPYMIAYAIGSDGKKIQILRVIHTARDWPVGGWPQ
ncbi:MAG: plasmid stabilization protein [Sphingomonas sp. 28-62-20]|uniref:type II toxin-antitoxin system RelE/ParE family toxin n=1 Tax=Sphingomonas sp. 28-62-20 TaxID=1970433 RepID=UPI000BD7D0C6|nr:MAG: plasmid stabilization protein [Sphingomonas sp. 28-62-20]